MKVVFFIPGSLNTPTGGYRYDQQMVTGLREQGMHVDVVSLAGTFPFPSGEAREAARAAAEMAGEADVAVVDGLAGGPLPEMMSALARKFPVVALVHHPLCLEDGLSSKQSEELRSLEAKGLDCSSAVVATSPRTVQDIRDLFEMPGRTVHAVLPGTDPAPVSMGGDGQLTAMLCVASLVPRKGHDTLVEALSLIKGLDWRLDCVGLTDRDLRFRDHVYAQITKHDLSNRIKFHGECSDADLEQAYNGADLFVLASRHEGYGMVFSEAVARCIPIVSTTAGAIPDTVPAGCGILVEPGDPIELANALSRICQDSRLRTRMRAAAATARDQFPTWNESVQQFADVLRSVS